MPRPHCDMLLNSFQHLDTKYLEMKPRTSVSTFLKPGTIIYVIFLPRRTRTVWQSALHICYLQPCILTGLDVHLLQLLTYY